MQPRYVYTINCSCVEILTLAEQVVAARMRVCLHHQLPYSSAGTLGQKIQKAVKTAGKRPQKKYWSCSGNGPVATTRTAKTQLAIDKEELARKEKDKSAPKAIRKKPEPGETPQDTDEIQFTVSAIEASTSGLVLGFNLSSNALIPDNFLCI